MFFIMFGDDFAAVRRSESQHFLLTEDGIHDVLRHQLNVANSNFFVSSKEGVLLCKTQLNLFNLLNVAVQIMSFGVTSLSSQVLASVKDY